MNIVMLRTLTLAALCAAVLVACSSSGPSDTVTEFRSHIEEGRIDEAYALVGGQAVAMFPEEKIKAGMSKETGDISKKGGISKLEILSEEVTGKTANVKTRTTYGNGESTEEAIDLTQLDGKWILTPSMEKKNKR